MKDTRIGIRVPRLKPLLTIKTTKSQLPNKSPKLMISKTFVNIFWHSITEQKGNFSGKLHHTHTQTQWWWYDDLGLHFQFWTWAACSKTCWNHDLKLRTACLCVTLLQVRGFQSTLRYIQSFTHSHGEGGTLRYIVTIRSKAAKHICHDHHQQAKWVKCLSQVHSGQHRLRFEQGKLLSLPVL